MNKLKGSIDTYLEALEDEIKRAKHQFDRIPHYTDESYARAREEWTKYISYLENLRIESCLLMDFEDEDETT